METSAATRSFLSCHIDRQELQRKREAAMAYLEKYPIRCAAVAAAAGFVLGGGLTTSVAVRLMRKGLGAVLQMAVVPFVLTRLRDVLVDTLDHE